MQQRHRFRRRRRFIQQRRVRHFHPRQLRHHRLEVEERLEAALRDLGLIRGVWRVPAGVLHHHPQNDARRDRVVVAEADVGAEGRVAVRQMRQTAQILVLAFRRRQVQRRREPDGPRDGFVDQRVERRDADRLEHPVAFIRRRSDVARGQTSRSRPACSSRQIMRRSYAALSSSDAGGVRIREAQPDHPCLVGLGVDGLGMIFRAGLTSMISPADRREEL